MMNQLEPITDCKNLNITSNAFKDHGHIPSKYTCEGEDINPPLDINGIPVGTKSLVLIMEDPDAPSGTWLHWLVWNIPVTQHIKEDEVPGDQGLNAFGRITYGGPCPPTGVHRYFFRIYALDDLLQLKEGACLAEVRQAMQNHVVGVGEVVGLYGKSK